jgi:hypothetical protein
MLPQLLVDYGVLQPIRNLLRFLKIDSEVFRGRTPGEPFDVAQRIRGLFTIFSDALHYGFYLSLNRRLVNRMCKVKHSAFPRSSGTFTPRGVDAAASIAGRRPALARFEDSLRHSPQNLRISNLAIQGKI